MFPESVLGVLDRAGDRPCFEHGGRVVSGGQVLATVYRVAARMSASGLSTGDGVAMLPGTSPEGFAALLAAFTLGLRVHAVRPGLTPAQFAHLVGAGVDAIVLDPAAAPTEWLDAVPDVPRYALGGYPKAVDLLAPVPRPARTVEPAGEHEAIGRISYTSGSTGHPKGVATPYRALDDDWPWSPSLWSPQIHRIAEGLDRYLLFGTLASPVMLDYVMATLFHGGVVVVPDTMPTPFFPAVLERYQITGSIMNVPRLYQMVNHLRTHRVETGSLRSLMVSGSPLLPARFAEALEVLGPVVFGAYGQTEVGTLTMLTPDDVDRYGAGVLSTVGRPLQRVRIRRENGELYVRTPYQGAGYWRDEQQTREVYAGGWVRTRDLGHLDDDGFVHLTGRTRDVVIVNAMVHYAGPIEAALAGHPDVDEAYVTGAPDEATGEAVHAFVVAAPGRVPDATVLRTLVAASLGEGAVPATVTVIPEVVAGPSGKPDKKATLTRYLPMAADLSEASRVASIEG